MSNVRKASRVQSAASTNATLVKAGSTIMFCGLFGNNGAGSAFVKFYDTGTVPVAGSGTPFATFLIPPSQNVEVELECGFGSGLGYTITGAAADNDTTAVLANQVTGVLFYD